jgi:hypothetical protein
MSINGLQTLIWQAVVSDDFRAGVLNGRRAELLQSIELDPDEAAEILAIRTETLPDFANGILELIQSRYPKPAPAWLEQARAYAESTSTLADL